MGKRGKAQRRCTKEKIHKKDVPKKKMRGKKIRKKQPQMKEKQEFYIHTFFSFLLDLPPLHGAGAVKISVDIWIIFRSIDIPKERDKGRIGSILVHPFFEIGVARCEVLL